MTPEFSLDTTLANARVFDVIDDVTEAWFALRDALIGALEYDDIETPHLRARAHDIPAAVARLDKADCLARAEVASTRLMLG